LKSVEARRARKLADAERILTAKAMIEVASRQIVEAQAPAAEDYVARRLARVRAQLDSLDERLAVAIAAKELDGRLLSDIAAAQARLATQEQQLAGRPLPGSRRPGKDRGARGGAAGGAGAEIQPED
jgi:hypothetical protein